MAKNQYYSDLKEQQLEKLKELKKELPRYTYDYLDDCRRSKQPSTVLAYAQDLKLFFTFIKESNPKYKDFDIYDIPKKVMDNLDYHDINEFQDFLESGRYRNEARGINRRLSAVRGFYKYSVDHGILSRDATQGSSRYTDKKKHETTLRLDNEEVAAVMTTLADSALTSKRAAAHAKNSKLRDTAIFTLFLGTGIRVSELVSLNISDFNFEKNSFSVTRKGGKTMVLYYSDDVKDALLSYIDNERPEVDDDALFLSNRKTRITVRSVENLVKKYSREITSKNISPHRLRKTFGTSLYRATGDIKLVADTLGHESITTTSKHYVDQSDSNRQVAARMNLYGKENE